MALKGRAPGRAYSPARKALSRSGLGLGRSPRRALSTSFQAPSKPVPAARPGARPGVSSKGSSANMKVVVRVRPLSQREKDNNARVIVDVVDEKMVVFDPKREEESFFFQGVKQKGRDMLKKQNKNAQYLFDRVFGCESTNEQVFEGSTKTIVTSVLDGFNCSVFVYGATGAGKTYTMLGTQENPGITFRTMVDLFRQIDEQKLDKDFEIGVSYLEVYNETVRDLLNPTSGALFLREDGGGVVVAGLKLERISDPDRMFELLEWGNRNRSQHPTDANAESSRSHAVFQVFIKMKTKANGQTKMVKLSMIDLAGSERGAATGCTGVRFKEGSNINKSLLALGNCINALADGLRHIPFRDSKLTRLLKDSLGGNCQTVMIANVAPAHHTYEDAHNTLKYATRAKSIKFQIKRNIVSVDLHVSHYIKMVEDLQTENERLKKETESLKKDLAETKALNQTTTSPPADAVPLDPIPTAHMPPAVAAVVAAIGNKIKPPVSTSTVAVNTSPIKGALSSDDIQRLKEEAENLYNEKARIHQRYLNMDSSDKFLRWRIKMKQRTMDRVQAMSSTPSRTDLAQIKVEKSVDQFKGRLNSVNEHQEVVSLEENEINERLLKIKEESERLGIHDELAPHFNAYELQFSNRELLMKCQHFEKLVEYLDNGFESHDEVLKKVSTLFRTYYNLVRGHGHMNKELLAEHETVMRGLEGIKSVQWRQERDQVFLTEMRDDAEQPSIQRPFIQHPSNEVSTLHSSVPSVSVVVSDSTAQHSLVPHAKVKEIGSTVLLQSPLCSSSSNPSDIPEAMDTASMLDTLEDLDSKVDIILNTSVSSMMVETGLSEVKDAPCTSEIDRPLNVTFDGEANLNSTFTKEEPVEIKISLNDTFEKQEESEHPLPSIGGNNLNGTFLLAGNSCVSVEASEPRRTSLPRASSSSPSNLKKLASPSSIGSPLLKSLSGRQSRSPTIAGTSANLSKKDLNGSPATLLKKSQLSSSSPSLAMSTATFLKKTSSPPVVTNALKKTGPAVSSPTFAVPAAVPSRAVTTQKRPVGVVDKKKALGSNVASIKQPGAKLVSINRKVAGSNPKINLNTPSKVKMAWNKENRNVNTVTSIKPTFKPTKSVVSMKPVPKPSAAPIPLNDTFTK